MDQWIKWFLIGLVVLVITYILWVSLGLDPKTFGIIFGSIFFLGIPLYLVYSSLGKKGQEKIGE